MSNYIFWPQRLLKKEKKLLRSVDIVAIAIKLESTDYVVLDISSNQSQEYNKNVQYPYVLIGEKKANQDWSIYIDDYNLIKFEVPRLRLMEFFSIDPIALVLPEKLPKDEEDNEKSEEIPNLKLLTNSSRYQAKNHKLRRTIDLINLYFTYLDDFHKNYPDFSTMEYISDRGVLTNITNWYRHTLIHILLCSGLYYVIVGICFFAYYGSLILNSIYIPAVKFSATAKQIDLRFQQFCYFPIQFLRINKNVTLNETIPVFTQANKAPELNAKKELPCKYYPDYIRFYNTIWLILNDISFGLILGALLSDNHDLIVKKLSKIISFGSYNFMNQITKFLANNPFGIKLNHELASFLSELFIWIIQFSHTSLIKLITNEENLGIILKFVTQTMCILGASFGLSLIIDFFSVVLFHIFLFYHISSKIYYWQLNAMISLFYLFCGKKRNVLRKRIDYNYFELDELLMGTLLFIVLVFLMPTVLSFYICYTLLWMVSIYFHIGLDSAIGLLNNFPLFAFLLRIKDPKRLPGGISIVGKETKSGGFTFELKNNPLKANMMFKPFIIYMNKISANYFSMGTFKNLLRGIPVRINRDELYRFLYSSLPDTPANIMELTEQLKESLPKVQSEIKELK